MLPQGKRIKYNCSDSATYPAGVINHCSDHDIFFTVTADRDGGVKEAIKNIKEWQTYQKDREIGETIHTMNNTKQAFWLIIQHWSKLQGQLFDPEPYCYHVIATDREESAEEIVHLHNHIGQVENFIKEIKDGYSMNWMSCGESYTNAVFFRIRVIAYKLFITMKLLALPSWYRSCTISTVRWQLYQTDGIIVRHGHKLLFKLRTCMDKII